MLRQRPLVMIGAPGPSATSWQYLRPLPRTSQHYETGDFGAAVADYSRAIELDPQIVNAWNNSGQAKRALGDIQGALADFEHAIALKPRYYLSHLRRGQARLDQGDSEGAIADLNRDLELKPMKADLWRVLAERSAAKAGVGDADGALQDWARAMKLNPELPSRSQTSFKFQEIMITVLPGGWVKDDETPAQVRFHRSYGAGRYNGLNVWPVDIFAMARGWSRERHITGIFPIRTRQAAPARCALDQFNGTNSIRLVRRALDRPNWIKS